jgi:hypothetical protein
MVVGIALGVLVGAVSGTALAIFLGAAFGPEGDLLQAGKGLLSMPATWFGGGWLTTVFDVTNILSAYVTSLAITVLAIGAIPMMKTVVWCSNRTGRTR